MWLLFTPSARAVAERQKKAVDDALRRLDHTAFTAQEIKDVALVLYQVAFSGRFALGF